jgi:hypothetical protein
MRLYEGNVPLSQGCFIGNTPKVPLGVLPMPLSYLPVNNPQIVGRESVQWQSYELNFPYSRLGMPSP